MCFWGASEPLFKGRNANWTQREPPALTVLGHTPTLSHKMMYPPTLVGVYEQNHRSSEARGADPLEKAPRPVPKFAISGNLTILGPAWGPGPEGGPLSLRSRSESVFFLLGTPTRVGGYIILCERVGVCPKTVGCGAPRWDQFTLRP